MSPLYGMYVYRTQVPSCQICSKYYQRQTALQDMHNIIHTAKIKAGNTYVEKNILDGFSSRYTGIWMENIYK